MEKREKILAGLTLACAFVFIVNQFVCAGEPSQSSKVSSKRKNVKTAKKSPTKKRPTPMQGQTLSNKELQGRLQNWEPLVSYETYGGDPFQPAAQLAGGDSVDTAESIRVSGIIGSATKRLAVIGDRIVQAGEKVGGMKISTENIHSSSTKQDSLLELYSHGKLDSPMQLPLLHKSLNGPLLICMSTR